MTGTSEFDFDVSGNGPALILLHGWPFHKETYRHILPALSEYFTCYNLNSMGMAHGGAGIIKGAMDFPDHADRVIKFTDMMDLKNFSILAHDTGATIARLVAAKVPGRVEKLVLLNTEMPGHRPPFIPLYQASMRLPASGMVLKQLMRSRLFKHSIMGFGESFYDKSFIDGEFDTLFVKHWIEDKARFKGLVKYLTGLNFKIIDTLDAVHKDITAPTQFIWGKNDVTFPSDRGRAMANTMPSFAEFIEIENTCFLPHEEKPKEVAEAALRFLRS